MIYAVSEKRETAKNIGEPTPIISLRRATKTFGIDDSATDALAGINLEIQQGEFVAIMGPRNYIAKHFGIVG